MEEYIAQRGIEKKRFDVKSGDKKTRSLYSSVYPFFLGEALKD
jgi:hypothetical protein